MSSAVISNSAGPRIVVVRLGAMGDVIHALPAVASLKHSFPGSHLTWLVEAQWAPLLERNPYVDRIAILERRNPGAWMRNWRKLRAERFDFAVDFQGLVKSALAASLSRPERIFGFHQSQVRERPAALFYSNRTVARATHVVDRNLELAADAGAVRSDGPSAFSAFTSHRCANGQRRCFTPTARWRAPLMWWTAIWSWRPTPEPSASCALFRCRMALPKASCPIPRSCWLAR